MLFIMSKSNYYCSVPMCDSWIRRNPTLSFHSFPSKNKKDKVFFRGDLVNKREIWLYQLKMGKQPSPYMKLCSLHFRDEDFFKGSNATYKLRRLKKTAVPTCKLPESSVSSRNPLNLNERQQQFKRRAELLCIQHQPEAETIEPTGEEVVAIEALLQLVNTQSNVREVKIYKDFEVEVITPNFITPSDLIKSETNS